MLFDHFHKGVCRNAPHTVQIVENRMIIRELHVVYWCVNIKKKAKW